LIVLGLITVKFTVLVIIGRFFGMGLDNNLLFAFGLAQGGEFAFVLFSYALQNGVMTADTANPLIAAVAVSMVLTPLMMLLNEKLIQPRFGVTEKELGKSDDIDQKSPVIIAGFGRFGSTIGRFLQANGVWATYLDVDPDNVDLLRKMGLKVFYGDASRHDLLHAAGANEAKLLIVAVDDPEKALDIVETAKKHFPNLEIIARSITWMNTYDILEQEIKGVYREFLDSALHMATDALSILGRRQYQVKRAVKTFRKHDETLIKEMIELRHQKKTFIRSFRQRIKDMEQMMQEDMENIAKDKDMGWDIESLKEEFGPRVKKMLEEEKKEN
jgi:CPA2 family monovalent cation:H+ antiporter-2/glutathione-regulated potassium-efflux system ancillary protein KefC/glutathione-regulated potassium-efflux system protein KefB